MQSGLILKRVLKYLNLAVAAAAAVVAALLYWFAWRPLPQTSGVLEAPIAARATVTRDRLGVPHISADTLEDALFLHGFVTAQDRLWQLDSLRRLAAGRLSEVVGPVALDSDRQARQLRLERIAEQHYQALVPGDRALLAAYARGVNFLLETHPRRLPLEFTVLGYQPRPWRVVDSILVGMQMFRTLTSSWRRELRKGAMLSAGDPEKVRFLFPLPAEADIQPGSNAWVLSGGRTASGRPVLAGDPHLEYSIPGIWHVVHLAAPGLNVIGVSIPGLPGVILGHNERIAWSVTNLEFDVQDLYLEKLEPGTGRYSFRGHLQQARLERDLIPVKGARPVELLQWVTQHGPVIAEEGNRFLALRWMAAEPSGFAWPFLELNRARNWQEFRAALSRFPGPGQNFVYADTEGNIGYQAAGRFPIRRNHDGDVPVDGSSGDYEWDGRIPFDELPRAFNPARGLIVTANQNPFPPTYPYRVNGNFAAPYRARQIQALLEARRDWRAENMPTLQKDVYSAFSHFLARQLVAAIERRAAADPASRDAAALLRAWDGQMEKDQAAPFIVTLAFQHLRRAVAERACPGQGAAYDTQMATVALERLLRERPRGWFDDYDQLLAATLADALEEGRRMQGRDLRKWRYGEHQQLLIAHPVGHHLPLVGKYFDIGPVPQSGSQTTVKQQARPEGYSIGPSMRMALEAADWDRSWLAILTGESGHVLSTHYQDQWEAFYTGRSFPLPFRKVEAAHTLVVEPH